LRIDPPWGPFCNETFNPASRHSGGIDPAQSTASKERLMEVMTAAALVVLCNRPSAPEGTDGCCLNDRITLGI